MRGGGGRKGENIQKIGPQGLGMAFKYYHDESRKKSHFFLGVILPATHIRS